MSSFFVGYVWTQLFGGRVAERFGGKEVIAIALFAAALLHFLLPWAAHTHLYLVVLQRVLTGFSLVSQL
jgi:MFS family permease